MDPDFAGMESLTDLIVPLFIAAALSPYIQSLIRGAENGNKDKD